MSLLFYRHYSTNLTFHFWFHIDLFRYWAAEEFDIIKRCVVTFPLVALHFGLNSTNDGPCNQKYNNHCVFYMVFNPDFLFSRYTFCFFVSFKLFFSKLMALSFFHGHTTVETKGIVYSYSKMFIFKYSIFFPIQQPRLKPPWMIFSKVKVRIISYTCVHPFFEIASILSIMGIGCKMLIRKRITLNLHTFIKRY